MSDKDKFLKFLPGFYGSNNSVKKMVMMGQDINELVNENKILADALKDTTRAICYICQNMKPEDFPKDCCFCRYELYKNLADKALGEE